MRDAGVFALLASMVLVAGCAIPGRFYLVAPAISGTLTGDGMPREGARLLLRIQHRESPTLYHLGEVSPSPEGGFSFEATQLVIAGQEFSKFYRAYLQLQIGAEQRIIWRAEFSRRELGGEIRLECDLERPSRHGQPCWVADPLTHPWLVSGGLRTYRRLCASCHGLDGSGEGAAVASVGGPPPDLRLIASRRAGRFDRVEISEWIEGRSLPAEHGTRDMPVWGERLSVDYERYTDRDALIGVTLDSVVVYLESLQEDDDAILGPP
ncbi:MAG: hypothetical protein JRH16_18565 [Deltaproteobacteria bacterium]|nr:hypothetical protein [Deltaproteobacteria bacterium]